MLLFILCGFYCERFVITQSNSKYAGYNSTTDKRILSDQYNKDVYCTKYKETDEIKESGHYCSCVRTWNRDFIPSSWNSCYCIGQISSDYKAYCIDHVYIGLTPQQSSELKISVRKKKQSQVNYLELFLTTITIFD